MTTNNDTSSGNDAATITESFDSFLRIEGPGRCRTCSWHVQTQGHHPECGGGHVEPCPAPDNSDFIDYLNRDKNKWRSFCTPVKVPQRQRKRRATNQDAWLDSLFDGVVEDVRKRVSGRNTRLRWAARRLGEFAHYERWDVDEARNALMDASAPWDNCEAWRKRTKASFYSGWNKGISEPKEVPEND